MKLKHSFEAIDMGDEIIFVPVGDGAVQVNGVLKTNKAGYEILELLKSDTTKKQIVDILAAKYDNDQCDLTSYVCDVLGKLRSANLLEE